MENDPELNGKYLGTITKDFVKVSETLREGSYHIRKRNISPYPIFIFARRATPLGSLLINADELGLDWHIYASYLDDFLQRKVITEDKVEAFKLAYKDADEFCCLFVIDEGFTNFVFIPFPED